MRRTRTALPAALAAAFAVGAPMLAVGGLTLAGCGGSSSATAPEAGGAITRATEENYSADARALVERTATEPRLSADVAARIDADLSHIRERFPAVQGIRARPRSDLHTLLVKPRSDAPWLSRWRAGDPVTGAEALDALLQGYGGVRVEPFALDGWYKVRYDEPLAIGVIGDRLEQTAAGAIEHAQPNTIVGDGPDIRHTPPASPNEARVYTFVEGWGDCAAGCINEHFWRFSVSPSGEVVLLEEGGDPLPAGQPGAA